MVDFTKKLKEQKLAEAEAKLQKRMSKIGPAKPTLIPEPRQKPKVPAEPVPELSTQLKQKDDLALFRKMLKRHREITDQESLLKAEKGALTEDLKAFCEVYKLEKGQDAGIHFVFYQTARKTIRKELLLAKNVSPAIILACTDISESAGFKSSRKPIEEYE